MQSFLVDLVSNKKLKVVEPKCKIGRDELNDIVITGDLAISRFHFLIIKDKDTYFVEDCQSRHGTFLNGNQVLKKEPISDGDVLKVGISLFWFVVEESTEESQPADDKVLPVDIASQAIQTLAPNQPKVIANNVPDTNEQPDNSEPKEEVLSDAQMEHNWQSDDLRNFLSDDLTSQLLVQDQTETIDSAINSEPQINNQNQPDEKVNIKEETLMTPNSQTSEHESTEESKTTQAQPVKKLSSLLKDLQNEGFGKVTEEVPISRDNSQSPEPSVAQTSEIIMQLATENIDNDKNSSTQSSPKNNDEENKIIMSTQTQTKSNLDMTKLENYLKLDIDKLEKALNEYNEQIKQLNEKTSKIEAKINLSKEIRENLLTKHNEDLVDSCAKVLSLLGFEVKSQTNDNQELRLINEHNEDCVVRIVWQPSSANRSDIGQLTMAQTKYWVESGNEPKGILIAAKQLDDCVKSNSETFPELYDYAVKRNVCLMTNMQLLEIFRNLTLSQGNIDTIKKNILETSGWLQGFDNN